MVLVQLLGAFAVGLAVGLIYARMFLAIPAYAVASGTFMTLIFLNQVPAWLARRRAETTEAVK